MAGQSEQSRRGCAGAGVARATWAAVIGGVWICFLAINATASVPAEVPIQTTARWIRDCVTAAAAFSLPALAVAGWLVARALPRRPALTGAACGLGVGIMADAGLRLLCWDGNLLHVLAAHGGAIAILMALGALSALVVECVKARR